MSELRDRSAGRFRGRNQIPSPVSIGVQKLGLGTRGDGAGYVIDDVLSPGCSGEFLCTVQVSGYDRHAGCEKGDKQSDDKPSHGRTYRRPPRRPARMSIGLGSFEITS